MENNKYTKCFFCKKEIKSDGRKILVCGLCYDYYQPWNPNKIAHLQFKNAKNDELERIHEEWNHVRDKY